MIWTSALKRWTVFGFQRRLDWRDRLHPGFLGFIAVLATLLMASPTTAWAQIRDDTPSPTTQAPIVLDGRELFHVNDLPGFSSAERATFTNKVLQNQVRRSPFSSGSIPIKAVEQNGLVTLQIAGRHLLTLTDQDLVEGVSIQEQATRWIIQLQTALEQAQYERTGAYYQQVGKRVLVTLLAIGSVYLLLRWGRRRIRRRRTRVSDWQSLWLETGILLMQWGLWIGLVIWLTGLFPQTRSIRYQVSEFLQGTLTTPIVILGREDYSILDFGKIVMLVLGLWLFVRILTSFIRSRVLQTVGASRDIQDAIALLIQITLVTLGLLILLQAVGIDISSLAILLSVVGVGIGFGLQNIASNFISGLIIMLERPVQVGDFIQLDDLTGTVERIGIRSTEVSTLDRVAIIVPNSEFISGKVINWNHGYPVSRLHIPFGVAYESSVKQVREAVLEAVSHHPQVLRYPKPQLLFEGFGDSALNFDLLVWIREPRQQFRIKSDLYYLLEANLRRHHITIPFPQRDLHIRAEDLSLLAKHLHADPNGQSPDALPTSLMADSPTCAEAANWLELFELTDEPTDADVQELVAQMRGKNGLDIRDRRFGLHLYRQCFVGSDAVNWLMQNQLASREEAVKLGQLLVERCLIHHVTDEHPFRDEYLFYRFFADEGTRTLQKVD